MKKLLIWCTSAFLLMLGGPCLALTFDGINGMAACIFLFFAANPLFSVICGLSAGKDVRRLWPLPIVTAAAFLAGAWLFLETGETDFLVYGGCYLLLGTAAMLIRAFFSSKKCSGHNA